MKKLLTFFGTLLMLGGMVAPLAAQEEDTAAETKQEASEVKVIPIAELLQEVKYVTKVKPKKKAVVYFFLRSHSSCGFCRQIAPQMNDLYKEMKNKGAELIMLNGDANTEKAKKWAKEMDIGIPMITPETASVIASKVPGGGSGGSPNVMAVMSDGEQIEGASGASGCKELVGNWKEMVKDAKKAEAQKKAEARKAGKKNKNAQKKNKKSKKAKSDEDEDV